MALLNRANLNSFNLLLNHYYKFATGTVRLKTRGRISVSSHLIQEKIKQNSEKKPELTNVKSTTFESIIANRRDQACRSMLVQVKSLDSQDDLQSYCAQFGDILSMHHYENKKEHYILIEFKDIVSINEIMSSASFGDEDSIAPVKSSVFWFRKGQFATLSYKKNYQKKIMLSTENGCTYPTEKEIANFLRNAKSLSGQIIDLYEALKLNDLEIRLRFHTAYHLEQYFSRLFQNIKVLPFGSSLNGFGTKRCDLDLVLILDNIQESKSTNMIFHTKSMKLNERHEKQEFMGILANTMQHFIPGINKVRRILEARVPIIKFNYKYTNIECDLGATNMSAVYMSELLNLYGEIDWRVRPLVTVIRKWAKSQKITSDSPGKWITNFPLSLLVLFYLQQQHILPSLKTLKLYATRDDIRCTENGIDCTFQRNLEKLPAEYKYKSNQDNLESLLYGFFKFISKFNFDTDGICIREGTVIPKPSSSALYITNPLETTLNVCKNVNTYELNLINEKAHDALFILETHNSRNNCNWGLLALLKMENFEIMDMLKLNIRKEQSIVDYLENYSDEISKVDINPSKKKKKTV